MSKELFPGLPDELLGLVDENVSKQYSKIQIKIERRKYGKIWAVLSGFELEASKLKEIVRKIKTRLACGGTIKNRNIEVLFGRIEKTKDLINILAEEGFDKESISISKEK